MLRTRRRNLEKLVKVQDRQDWLDWVYLANSAKVINSALAKGKLEAGYLLFSGSSKEEKIARQLARYYDLDFVGIRQIPCQRSGVTNTLNVPHYYFKEKSN